VIFVDDLQRHEALAGIRQRDRHRPGVEIEHRRRIERVAVHPDHDLVVDVGRRAIVDELAEASVLHGVPEVEIGFGADEVVAGDGHRRSEGSRVLRERLCRDRECGGGNECNAFHCFSPVFAVWA
jgi:hypothetical protein